jgi:hypothetical protein
MCDEVRLRAKVKEVLSPSNNYIGTIVDGLPVPVTKLPEPDWLEISGEYGGFFVFYLDAALVCFADSWHCREWVLGGLSSVSTRVSSTATRVSGLLSLRDRGTSL